MYRVHGSGSDWQRLDGREWVEWTPQSNRALARANDRIVSRVAGLTTWRVMQEFERRRRERLEWFWTTVLVALGGMLVGFAIHRLPYVCH